MSRRSKIVIAVVVIFFLLLLALLFLLSPKKRASVSVAPAPTPVNAPAGGLNVATPGFNINVSAPPSTKAPAVPPKVDDRNALKIIAKTFAELFGSYSSEGNEQNVIDSEYYMTDSLKAWATSYVATERAKPPTTQFSGTTTRALFEPDVTAYDDNAGTATVTVKTQRSDSGPTIASSSVYYQDLTLEFVKVGGVWKVDKYAWGAK
jgi:hypothetical protein